MSVVLSIDDVNVLVAPKALNHNTPQKRLFNQGAARDGNDPIQAGSDTNMDPSQLGNGH